MCYWKMFDSNCGFNLGCFNVVTRRPRMDVNLSTIGDRFPEWSSLIEWLYQKNASFHSLCDNYFLVLARIKQCGSSEVSISSADR